MAQNGIKPHTACKIHFALGFNRGKTHRVKTRNNILTQVTEKRSMLTEIQAACVHRFKSNYVVGSHRALFVNVHLSQTFFFHFRSSDSFTLHTLL